MRILLAEDEPTIALTLGDALEEREHTVFKAADTASAEAILERESPELVITDIRMPGAGGMSLLSKALQHPANPAVIVMTGYATVDQAVEAMKAGAFSYVQKPFRNAAMLALVDAAARQLALLGENRALRAKLALLDRRESQLGEMVGCSSAMHAVFERIRQVGPLDTTVLIEGESGTGKERAAKALHEQSPRAAGPFVAISCAALPESLLEAELFGHEKGAFTDAHKERKGRFELAHKGTLFLDDIDDMPKTVQVKLLRVLQERRFERLGGEETRALDLRFVAATKAPLRDEVRAGRFREDLFYRIHVVPLRLPPLRERQGDVPLLVMHLIERHGRGEAYKVSPASMAALERYPWPGNVRELENAVQRAIALAGPSHELERQHLLPLDERWRGATETATTVRPLREVLREAELAHLKRALAQTGGHRTQTAELLGISRKVLWEKLRDLGLDDGEGPRAS